MSRKPRPLPKADVDALRSCWRFAEKRSAEAVVRRLVATVDMYRGALETVAQWDPSAAEMLRERDQR